MSCGERLDDKIINDQFYKKPSESTIEIKAEEVT